MSHEGEGVVLPAIDESLVQEAAALTDIADRGKLINEALRALIQRESSRDLGNLYAAAPHLAVTSARSSAAAASPPRHVANEGPGFEVETAKIRIEVEVDRRRLDRAKELFEISNLDDLLDFALRKLVERESGRRLAAMGGTMPDLEDIPRRPR